MIKNRAMPPKAMIFMTVLIDLIGFGIVIPVLPLYAQRFGASAWQIGFLLAVYSAMQLVFAPLLGRWSDRIGRRPVLLLSLIGTSVGFVVMGWAPTLAWVFVGRIIDGVSGANISTAQAYIADVTPPEHRSRGMGLIGAAFGLGFIFGPAIGGGLSHISMGAPFLFAGALAAANTLAVLFMLPESLPPQRRAQAMAQRQAPVQWDGADRRMIFQAIGVYFLTTVAFSTLTATYPLFTFHRFGFDAAQNGYIFATLGVASAIVQGGLLGWLVARFRDKGLAIFGTILLGASLFILPYTAAFTALWLATAGVILGHSFVAPTMNGVVSRSSGVLAQGRALGWMQSATSLARIIGPILGGGLLHYDAVHATARFGQSPYWAAGIIMVAAAVLAVMLAES